MNLLITKDDLAELLASWDSIPDFMKAFNVIPLDRILKSATPLLVFTNLVEMEKLAQEYAARSQ